MPPTASIAPQNDHRSFKQRKTALADLNSWLVKGGIAVKEGQEGFTASMLWHQYSPSAFKIQFAGPFAVGKVVLTKDAGVATIQEGEKRYSSSDANALLKAHTGHHVPVSSLYYWLRGLPSPQASCEKSLDEFGHVATLKQHGWVVEYQRFTRYKGFDVPAKIRLTKGNSTVKLIISSWQ